MDKKTLKKTWLRAVAEKDMHDDEAVDANAALRCHAEWMDWCAVSSTQTAACRERTCMTTTWTTAINHVSASGHIARVCHEV